MGSSSQRPPPFGRRARKRPLRVPMSAMRWAMAIFPSFGGQRQRRGRLRPHATLPAAVCLTKPLYRFERPSTRRGIAMPAVSRFGATQRRGTMAPGQDAGGPGKGLPPRTRGKGEDDPRGTASLSGPARGGLRPAGDLRAQPSQRLLLLGGGELAALHVLVKDGLHVLHQLGLEAGLVDALLGR